MSLSVHLEKMITWSLYPKITLGGKRFIISFSLQVGKK